MAGITSRILIGDYLTRAAGSYPERIAVVDGERRLTFRELNERADRLARALRRQGVRPGDKVATLLYNGAAAIETFFGALKAGAVIVPLNYRFAPAELSYVIENSDARLLIFGSDFASPVAELLAGSSPIERLVAVGETGLVGVADYEALLAAETTGGLELDLEVTEAAPCAIVYTGGTTGQPKGVVRTHKNVSYSMLVCAIMQGIRPGDRYLATAPMFHVAGLESAALPALGVGATIVSLRTFDPVSVFAAIAAERITHVMFVPAMAIMLLKAPERADFDLSSLRHWQSGTAPLPVQVNRALHECFPGVGIRDAYGSTEALMTTTLGPEDQFRKVASVGLPAPTQHIRVVDEDDGDLPVGEVGEIVCQSPMVFQEYYKNEAETSMALRNGWYHTGDMGRFDEEGYLYLVDRKKDMIISGGENVFAVEVENVLFSHPSVAEAAVIGLPDAKWGEIVTAVIALKPGASATEEEIEEYCRGKIAGYKRPRLVRFIDVLPRSSMGKVQKSVLRKTFGGTEQAVSYTYEDSQIAPTS